MTPHRESPSGLITVGTDFPVPSHFFIRSPLLIEVKQTEASAESSFFSIDHHYDVTRKTRVLDYRSLRFFAKVPLPRRRKVCIQSTQQRKPVSTALAGREKSEELHCFGGLRATKFHRLQIESIKFHRFGGSRASNSTALADWSIKLHRITDQEYQQSTAPTATMFSELRTSLLEHGEIGVSRNCLEELNSSKT